MGFSIDIGGVADLVTGSSKKAAKRQNELARRDAKTFIQDRVKDAQAAGVHPLFALGANYSPPSVTPLPDWSGIGSFDYQPTPKVDNYAKGREIARTMESDDLVRRQANARIHADETLANLHASEAALNRQRLISEGRDALGLSSPEQITSQLATQAGVSENPAWGVKKPMDLAREYRLPGGGTVWAPNTSDPGESIAENPLFWALFSSWASSHKSDSIWQKMRNKIKLYDEQNPQANRYRPLN